MVNWEDEQPENIIPKTAASGHKGIKRRQVLTLVKLSNHGETSERELESGKTDAEVAPSQFYFCYVLQSQ